MVATSTVPVTVTVPPVPSNAAVASDLHCHWRGPVPLRPTPKSSEPKSNVKPAAAVRVNSKYFERSTNPVRPPTGVSSSAQADALKLPELKLVLTPFFVRLPTVRFKIGVPF